MYYADLKKRTLSALAPLDLHPEQQQAELRLIVEGYFEIPWTTFLACPNMRFEQSEALEALLHQRVSLRMPLQYVLGTAHWASFKLKVTPAVLIPRPETELLAEAIIELCQRTGLANPVVGDMGTGSGALAMALKKALPQAEVYGVDLSPDALVIAAENAATYGLDIQWHQGDFTAPQRVLPKSIDVIVSNPPYIAPCDTDELTTEVQHEPALALFCPIQKPPLYYRDLIVHWLPLLKDNGFMGIELGHHTSVALNRLLSCDARLLGCQWQFISDFQGIARHLILSKGILRPTLAQLLEKMW